MTLHTATSPISAPLRAFLSTPPDSDRQNAAPDTARSRHRIAGMSLKSFALAGLVLRVRSRLLGEDVLFASDNAHVDRQDLVVYRAAELETFLDAKEAELMALHRARSPES